MGAMVTQGISREDAVALAKRLRRESGPLRTGGRRVVRAFVEGDARDPRIVFTGGTSGDHQLWLNVSSEARILAHWQGYVENAGLALVPDVGAAVSFPSASASRMGGWRVGRVLSVGPRRARVAFTYKTTGRASVATVALSELRFT